LVGIGRFVIRAQANIRPATEDAMQALKSTDDVTVSLGQWQMFTPTNQESQVGFIFYPGGAIDESAYAPAMAKIAEQGYLVVNVDMPLALARFGSGQAENVIATYPEIQSWVIGGHSLGGEMAAKFTLENPSLLDGLILWAAYPSRGAGLTALNLSVITIFGTLDGGVRRMEYALSQLPASTTIVRIEGGNHGQFGDYVAEPGDRQATIPREEQQAQIMTATLAFLSQFGE
jgi:predicted alpha/beta-hydrolase family hydrolase